MDPDPDSGGPKPRIRIRIRNTGNNKVCMMFKTRALSKILRSCAPEIGGHHQDNMSFFLLFYYPSKFYAAHREEKMHRQVGKLLKKNIML
jgi:hypothetical protein